VKRYALRNGYYQSATIHSGKSKSSVPSGAGKASVFKALPQNDLMNSLKKAMPHALSRDTTHQLDTNSQEASSSLNPGSSANSPFTQAVHATQHKGDDREGAVDQTNGVFKGSRLIANLIMMKVKKLLAEQMTKQAL